MTAILRITDGTTTVNLLSPETEPGFHLQSWRPTIPFYKGGGTFQESSLSWGRTLVDKQFENIIDTFSLKANDINQDGLIQVVQDLRRLLEKASSYWVADWSNEPVWIEAKASQESNTRYSLIVTGRIPQDENPYSTPFLQPQCASIMDNLDLIVEHLPWTENEPGTGTPVKTSSIQTTFEDRTVGNVDSSGTREPTSDDEDYVVMHYATSQLSDIYMDDGGVFTANLLDAALPFNMLPGVPAANDAIYFGISEDSLASPFCSLVFDIGTAGAGYSATWEYWNGAWVALTIQDNTNQDGVGAGIPFDTTGVNSVHWELPNDWAVRDLSLDGGPAVIAYWVRLRIVGGGGNGATQQNRDIYTISWPFVEIQSTEILGDIRALAKIKVQGQSHPQLPAPPELWANRVVCGLRSVDRGDDFTAYISLSNFNYPSVIYSVSATGVASFSNDTSVITGKKISVVNPNALAQVVQIYINNSADALQYNGEFHVFVRGQQTNGVAGDIGLQLRGFGRIQTDPVITDVVYFTTTGMKELLDFGKITINTHIAGKTLQDLEIEIWATGNGSSDAELYDLILIPVDEFVFDSLDQENTTGSIIGDVRNTGGTYLLVDSITDQRVDTSLVLDPSNSDAIMAVYLLTIASEVFLPNNKRYRLWFLAEKYPTTGTDVFDSLQEVSFTVQAWKQQRYLSMRGAE